MINVLPHSINTATVQPIELNSQKTIAPRDQETVDSPPPSTPKVRPILSRSRQALHNPVADPDPLKTSIRQFADALVEQGDRQLAINLGNGLISKQLASLTQHLANDPYTLAVPPNSTFGQAWSELADALESEPFKSFAEAKLIDISQLIISHDGSLEERSKDGGAVSFFSRNDPEWSAVSAAVLAAAKKVMGPGYPEVSFYGRDHASAHNICEFYGLLPPSLYRDNRLSTAAQLLRDGSFNALISTDPLDAPIKQKQREARQHIADLPSRALGERLKEFAPSTARQKVQQADQALAQLVSRGMMKLLPETSDYQTSVTLQNIPEYSTFNLVRENLLKALTGSVFTAFAQENKLDPTSVRINPVSGELMGTVEGVDTRFNLNDVSGWNNVWTEIKESVQQMAAGSEDDVTYPIGKSADLYEVMAFYNEPPPPQEQDSRADDWPQRQLKATLGRIDEMVQNNGFKALIGAAPSDPQGIAVRQCQQAMTQQLENTPLSPSPLETLAAAVKANLPAPAESEAPPEDILASAERALATTVHRAMLELQADSTQAASKTVQPIPANSLFGQWQAYLNKALKGRGFTEWAQKQNIDLNTLRFDPTDKALIGKVNGVDQRFTAADFAKKYPDYFDVLAPVLKAAEALTAHGKPIELTHISNGRAPLEWVCNFYGVSTDSSSAAFAQSTALIGRTLEFPARPEHPTRIVHWLDRQKAALGDSNDRYALIKQLEDGIINRDESEKAMRFAVDPDSSHQPKGIKTARSFISENGWNVPQRKAETDNLLLALRTPIPQAPALGNRWGFLSTDIPLDTDQRGAVMAFVKEAIGTQDSLLGYLSSGVASLSANPEQALTQLLSSDKAIKLATDLQTEMKGAITTTSLQQWLLTALVLELDTMAGTSRNTVAGFDFMHSDNWGLDSSKIRERLSQHLTDNKKVPANLASLATLVLMSGAAPHLLVQGSPSTVTLGSPEWVSFVTAANRIEHLAAGATATMTYAQVMDFHKISPISASEAQVQAIAQMNPVIDWAIINNYLTKNGKDEYTLEQLTSSQEKLQKQIKETADARLYLRTHEAPNRRTMALEVLKSKFGTGIDFTSRFMLESFLGGTVTGIRASIVEIYEAGRLGGSWKPEGSQVNFERIREKAHELPDINTQFDKAIEEDFTLRRTHTLTLFKDMLSKLPLAERNSLNYGAVEFLQVEGAGSGIVMTSVHQGVRRDFAVYPASGQITRIPDIDPATPLGQKVSLAIDVQAFKNGTEPKPGVTSEVILRPSEQFILTETKDGDKRPLLRERLFTERNASAPFSPYDSERVEDLAKVLVDTNYLRKGEYVSLHRDWFSNAVEHGVEPSDFFKSVLTALPGGSSLIDIYHGEYAKAAGDLAVDIAIYVATEGAGKLWTVAKSGAAWATAKASAKFIEKFGVQETQSIAFKDLSAATTAKSLSAGSRIQGSQLTGQAVETFIPTADMADGTVIRSRTREQVKVTALLQDSEWYAYNPRTMATEGPALKGFVPESNKRNINGFFDSLSPARPDSDMPARFEVNVIKAKYGDEAAFKIGYDTVKPDTISGYRPDMGRDRIKHLIADSNLTNEQVGSLVRQLEKLTIGHARTDAEIFKREVEAAGGTTRGMPQSFYLSLTQVDVAGECAALSNAMALALTEGNENTLIDNLTLAMANPESAQGSRFIADLSALHANVTEETRFHSNQLLAPTPYKNIIAELSNPKTSKTLMISSTNHGMLAGVRIDAGKKTWFYYDPNYGLAKFTSEDSMKAGLEKVLNSGTVGKGLDSFGNLLTGPKFKVSTFDVEEMAQREFDIARVRSLSTPLRLDTAPPPASNLYGRIRLGGPMETVRPLDGEIQTFVDTYDGKPRLNIIGHAQEPEKLGEPVKIVGDNDARYSAAEVNQKLLDRGVDIRDYANVRTLTCFSASGGSRSFSAELHQLTGVPVKGFEGPVTTEWMAGTDLNEQYQKLLIQARKKYPKSAQADIEWVAEHNLNKIYHQQFRVFTVRKDVGTVVEANIGTTKNPVYITLPIDYRPVRFGPAKAPAKP